MDMATAMRMGRADLVAPAYQSQVYTNAAYQDSPGMKEYNAMDAQDTAPIVGSLGLSFLSLMILGVMVFYIGTRGRQS
jgi:hypothetical protein